MAEVKVTATGKEFGKAVARVKHLRGVYDGQTQTWTIPDVMLQYFQPWGLRLVTSDTATATRGERGQGCPNYTINQGCPLHGELCAEKGGQG